MSLMDYFEQKQRSASSRLILCLMSVSAVVLVIACLNLASMMVVQGSSRQREIAIRLALGATRKEIMLLVFRQGSVSTLVGLGCGLIAGLGLAHLLRSMIINVSPVDPISIGITIIVLALTSLLAALDPRPPCRTSRSYGSTTI